MNNLNQITGIALIIKREHFIIYGHSWLKYIKKPIQTVSA